MSNWQVLPEGGSANAAAPTVGGGGTPLAGYRSLIDAKRSAATPRTPNAEYPDGYIGNLTSRRSDRLLQAVQSRLTQRNYQRGIHKGERIDQSDYFWPEEFNPDSGLEAESRGLKWTAGANLPQVQINHMGKSQLLSEIQMGQMSQKVNTSPMAPIDPRRQNALARMLPTWST